MPHPRKFVVSARARTALITEELEARDQPAGLGLGLGLSGLLPAVDMALGLGAAAAHDPPGLAAAAPTAGSHGQGHDVVSVLAAGISVDTPAGRGGDFPPGLLGIIEGLVPGHA